VSLPLPPRTPPEDIDVLKQRAQLLAGRSVGELAALAELPVPADLRRSKGFVGQLLERWLGAGAGNRPLPDFTHLGIELKTLPVDGGGKPLQSTYVTKVPLSKLDALEWRTSSVFTKLRHVMWVPVEAERDIPLVDRVVGQAFFWQPNAEEEQLLRADWEYHLARIRAGDVNLIRGGDGAVLQMRPKAPSGRTFARAELPDHGDIIAKPRGFYLRPVFTHYLIQRYFHHIDSAASVEELMRALGSSTSQEGA